MKKILLVLAMIAASVFLAQPAVAEGEAEAATVTATTEDATTPAPAEPTVEPLAEEPPPPVVEEPAPAAEEPAPAAEEPAPAAEEPEAPGPVAKKDVADQADDAGAPAPKNDVQAKDAVETESESAVIAAAAVKVWVCKYVGTPGVDERLKEGKQPIETNSNSLPGKPTNVQVGDIFNDEHGRSIVVQVGGADPGPGACAPGDVDTEVTTEDPIVSPATCDEDGVLTLPTTPGVLYTVTPAYTGPGTYDVVATALDGYVLSGASTTAWNNLKIDDQLTEGCQQDVKKVWVCKYVGKPGVDEVLKGGKNPIEVSVNALPGSPDNPQVGDEFVDAQERSVVVALSPANPEPTVEDCLPPIVPKDEVTPEPPTATPATCDADGKLVLPETEGIVYTSEPEGTGPGDYVVTAAVADETFVIVGDAEFEITVDEQLPAADCVSPAGKEEENDLLPDTGGLPLWILLLAGPMTAAGLIVLMRRQPVDHTSTSGRMPSYSLILPPAKKPAGIKRAHAATQHIGFMKAVGNVVAAIGSFLRGGRR